MSITRQIYTCFIAVISVYTDNLNTVFLTAFQLYLMKREAGFHSMFILTGGFDRNIAYYLTTSQCLYWFKDLQIGDFSCLF